MSGAATIYVSRLDSTAAFYQECFALEVVDAAAGDYKVLESQVWTLSIVQVPAVVASSIHLSAVAVRREHTPIKLAFDVTSIKAHRVMILANGGQVDDTEWEFRGYWHCDFVDPEGNVGQLRERRDG